MGKKEQTMSQEPFFMNDNKNPVTINGMLNMNWLKEEAKKMTPKKMEAIQKRNEALAEVSINQREEWVKLHPLESFMEKTHDENYDIER